jgi:hypothetical protein
MGEARRNHTLQVLTFWRRFLRGRLHAGRLPWLAFLTLRPGLAMGELRGTGGMERHGVADDGIRSTEILAGPLRAEKACVSGLKATGSAGGQLA